MLTSLYEWIEFLLPSKFDSLCISVASLVIGFFQAFIGGFDAPIQALLFFALIDYITGTLCAVKRSEWSSEQGFRGLTKKFSIFVVVGFCHWVDIGLSMDILKNAAIVAYVINEVGSLLENIDRLGFGYLIPEWLRQRLAVIKQERMR